VTLRKDLKELREDNEGLRVMLSKALNEIIRLNKSRKPKEK